jgi:hypothetical protein
MSVISIFLNVSYSQITVFDSALEQPFNLWTERHVKQGFSWRQGSVSFGTIDEAARYTIDIVVGEDLNVSPQARRVIQTPFQVPPSGSIEIASIADNVPLSLPGIYALRYECFLASDELGRRIRFLFTRTENPTFKILRADSEMSAGNDLLLSTSPA